MTASLPNPPMPPSGAYRKRRVPQKAPAARIPRGGIEGACRRASLPALDFCARYLMAIVPALDGDHGETANILEALKEQVDTERDRRIALERGDPYPRTLPDQPPAPGQAVRRGRIISPGEE